MQDHFIFQKSLEERQESRRKKVELTELETSHVAIATDEFGKVDESKFTCRKCNGKVLSKQSCLAHMTKVHSLEKNDVYSWATYKDARMFANTSSPTYLGMHLKLTRALHEAHGALSSASSESDEAQNAITTASSNASAHVASSADLATSTAIAAAEIETISGSSQSNAAASSAAAPDPNLALLAQVIRTQSELMAQSFRGTPTTPAVEAIPVPNIAIKLWIQEWVEPDEWADKRRNYCPVKDQHKDRPDFADLYEHFLAVNLDASTVNKRMAGIRRFFDMIETDDATASHAGIILAMYQNNLFQRLFSLPIMNPKYTWGYEIAMAIEDYAQLLATTCGKHKQMDEKRQLEQILPEALYYYKQKCIASQKGKRSMKNETDGEILESENFAEVADLKAAVKQAMLDLNELCEMAARGETLTSAMLHAANSALMIIIYLNGFAGRSGEWESATSEYILECLGKHKWYIRCKTHKTVKIYGEVGKGLQPGTITAIKKYLDLPGKTTDRLLEPSREGAVATVHSCLKTGSALYLSGRHPVKVNLIRKMYHTKWLEISRTPEVMKILEVADKHSRQVAFNTYCCKTAKRDAEYGLELYKGIFGEPVAWPTEDEISLHGVTGKDIGDFCLRLEEDMYGQIVPFELPSDEESLIDVETMELVQSRQPTHEDDEGDHAEKTRKKKTSKRDRKPPCTSDDDAHLFPSLPSSSEQGTQDTPPKSAPLAQSLVLLESGDAASAHGLCMQTYIKRGNASIIHIPRLIYPRWGSFGADENPWGSSGIRFPPPLFGEGTSVVSIERNVN